MKSQHGSIALNVLLVLLLLVIGILIYLLAGARAPQAIRVTGVESPTMPTTSAAPTTQPRGTQFTDGLGRANSATEYPLDETGAGVARVEVFKRDINNDGQIDRITKRRVENGTDHFYDEYTIELANGNKYIDITPDNFRTIEGADCALQRLRFIFNPQFQVIKISRPWQDSWTNPTAAVKTTYALRGGQMQEIKSQNMKAVCNVADLFD